jgi:hypothetical protein
VLLMSRRLLPMTINPSGRTPLCYSGVLRFAGAEARPPDLLSSDLLPRMPLFFLPVSEEHIALSVTLRPRTFARKQDGLALAGDIRCPLSARGLNSEPVHLKVQRVVVRTGSSS